MNALSRRILLRVMRFPTFHCHLGFLSLPHSSNCRFLLSRPHLFESWTKIRSSSSSSTPAKKDGLEPDEVEWDNIDETGMKGLVDAHFERKHEMDVEMVRQSQIDKLDDVRTLRDYLINGPSEGAEKEDKHWRPLSNEARDECDRVWDLFERRMKVEMQKTEDEENWKKLEQKTKKMSGVNTFKRYHWNAVYCLMRALYRDTVKESGKRMNLRRQQKEKAELERIEAALDHLPSITAMKHQYFLGSLLLADGQATRFLDFLMVKYGKAQFDGSLLSMICYIAMANKEASILEPLLELAHFLPSNFLHLAKVYNSLVMIYGLNNELDKMEQLGRQLQKQSKKTPFPDQTTYLKPILFRISYFYRNANRKLPTSVALMLRLLEQQEQPYFISANEADRDKERRSDHWDRKSEYQNRRRRDHQNQRMDYQERRRSDHRDQRSDYQDKGWSWK